MKDLNVVSILQIGVIGLVFLLALLAYRLLRSEQNSDKDRPWILRTIWGFMVFSVVVGLLGMWSEFRRLDVTALDAVLKAEQAKIVKLTDDLAKVRGTLVERRSALQQSSMRESELEQLARSRGEELAAAEARLQGFAERVQYHRLRLHLVYSNPREPRAHPDTARVFAQLRREGQPPETREIESVDRGVGGLIVDIPGVRIGETVSLFVQDDGKTWRSKVMRTPDAQIQITLMAPPEPGGSQ